MGLFVFLFLSFMQFLSSLYIWEFIPLSYIQLSTMFSRSVGCRFLGLTDVFERAFLALQVRLWGRKRWRGGRTYYGKLSWKGMTLSSLEYLGCSWVPGRLISTVPIVFKWISLKFTHKTVFKLGFRWNSFCFSSPFHTFVERHLCSGSLNKTLVKGMRLCPLPPCQAEVISIN